MIDVKISLIAWNAQITGSPALEKIANCYVVNFVNGMDQIALFVNVNQTTNTATIASAGAKNQRVPPSL